MTFATVNPADNFLERLPGLALDWVLGLLPDNDFVRWLVASVLAVAVILAVFGLLFAFTTVTERKLLGRFQNRPGPNRVRILGIRFFGFFQPFADAVKALTKEDLVPAAADKILHFLAPAGAVFFTLLGFAVIPYGRHLTPLDLDAGVLYFFAAGAASELVIFMAGWSSQNKYSLLSAMRALAQLISFELPLLLVVVPVVLAAGTLGTSSIVTAQGGWSLGGLIPHWNVLTPWGLAGFVIFVIAALAETNRCPFDLPEGESEIIAGHLTEYSGFKYALFFMGEYFGIIGLCGLGVTLFLGGWQAPCEFLQFIPSYLWFGLKLIALILFFIWIRATLLRLRIDQLTRLAWKLLVPLGLINLGVAAFWMLTASWDGPVLLAVRWAVGLALILIPYVLLGRSLGSGLGPRNYRYAQ
ncbi:NADH dehydrogenase [Termitidicoccus mucosus]|uniref:NADH-quinone oxidoreductase subunit H n=1 Tax=Termitidicoccus mucosus TaxID=1184151 RepID=A0A178IEP2_9BACT|nr:NADH dehydrogenase [Opitutaceae bacterium TSB47]